MRTAYLFTPSAAIAKHYIRRNRTIHLHLDQEPLAKKSMKSLESKRSFQLEVMQQLKKQKKKGFLSTTTLSIDFDVYADSKTPPYIHNIPKNYLDLLSKPIGLFNKSKKIVFDDDKQIKCLNIRYHIGEKKKSIDINIYPFKALIEDIIFAESLDKGEFTNQHNPFIESMLEQEQSAYARFYEDYDDYSHLQNDQCKHDKYYQKTLMICQYSVQDSFLQAQSQSSWNIYFLLCDKVSYSQSIMESLYKNTQYKEELNDLFGKQLKSRNEFLDHILNSPMAIKLPPVPTQDKQTDIFKRIIYQRMIEYRDKYRFLTPMLVPVSIKVFYKKPVTKNPFYKDLDNIMKIIVPKFHEVFKPPVSVLQMSQDNPKYELELSHIPKSIQHQISAYEIIEIPRRKDDISDGFVCIILCDQYSKGIYEKTEDIIFDWFNNQD